MWASNSRSSSETSQVCRVKLLENIFYTLFFFCEQASEKHLPVEPEIQQKKNQKKRKWFSRAQRAFGGSCGVQSFFLIHRGDVPFQGLRSLTFYVQVWPNEATTFSHMNSKNVNEHIACKRKTYCNTFWSLKVLFHPHKQQLTPKESQPQNTEQRTASNLLTQLTW